MSIRYAVFQDYIDRVNEVEGGLDNFTKGYTYYGMQFNNDNSVTCREWAPGAVQVYLMGEFSKLSCKFSLIQMTKLTMLVQTLRCLFRLASSLKIFEFFFQITGIKKVILSKNCLMENGNYTFRLMLMDLAQSNISPKLKYEAFKNIL